MKKIIFLTMIVNILLLVNLVRAEHVSVIRFVPDSLMAGEEESIKVVVENSRTSLHSIRKVELFVPLDKKNESIYKIGDEFTIPPGWEPALSFKAGKMYSISFSSVTGISPGASASFSLNSVKAPTKLEEHVWSWETTDTNNKTFKGNVTTKVKPGTLAYFTISVPSETKVGKAFNASIIAYDKYNNTKTDYLGTITFKSTDPNASFAPEKYTFTLADKGKAVIWISYGTAGNQTITVRDEEAKIEKTSSQTVVLPITPSKLSIVINEDKPLTDKILVTLSLQATDAEKCRYSNDKIIWSEWEAYNKTKSWNLIPGDGTKTVYYQCKNEAGESEIVSDKIELRTVPLITPFVPHLAVLALILSIISLGISLTRGRARRKEEKS
jgi:hypothetical protein